MQAFTADSPRTSLSLEITLLGPQYRTTISVLIFSIADLHHLALIWHMGDRSVWLKNGLQTFSLGSHVLDCEVDIDGFEVGECK